MADGKRKETLDEYVARGGTINKLPFGASALGEIAPFVERAAHARRAKAALEGEPAPDPLTAKFADIIDIAAARRRRNAVRL